MRGRFTLAEMQEAAYTDPAILELRSRVELVADPDHATFDGASLAVEFTDGTTEAVIVPNFLGTPGNPMSDNQLSEVFRVSAEGLLSPKRASAILDAAWRLESAPDLDELLSLSILDLEAA